MTTKVYDRIATGLSEMKQVCELTSSMIQNGILDCHPWLRYVYLNQSGYLLEATLDPRRRKLPDRYRMAILQVSSNECECMCRIMQRGDGSKASFYL